MLVYLIKNKINGMCYVGQTIQPLKERWKGHQYRGNTKLKQAIKEFGRDNFEVLQLCEADNPAQLTRLEEAFILICRSKTPNGYNMTDGGKWGAKGNKLSESAKAKLRAYRLGKKASAETRKKIGEVQQGEKNHNFGKTMSQAQKDKLAAAARAQWARLSVIPIPGSPVPASQHS